MGRHGQRHAGEQTGQFQGLMGFPWVHKDHVTAAWGELGDRGWGTGAGAGPLWALEAIPGLWTVRSHRDPQGDGRRWNDVIRHELWQDHPGRVQRVDWRWSTEQSGSREATQDAILNGRGRLMRSWCEWQRGEVNTVLRDCLPLPKWLEMKKKLKQSLTDIKHF